MGQDTSPVPSKQEEIVPAPSDLPVCCVCGDVIEKIRTIDYGAVRLVIHDTVNRCTIGTLTTPEHE